MNWDKSNDEDVKEYETTWESLDDDFGGLYSRAHQGAFQEEDDEMSSAWANSFRKRIQEFEQKQPLTPDDVMERQIREEYIRRVESINKLNDLLFEWQYDMPSIDEVASTVSFEMAKQYDNPHDFELVKQNVYSAVAAVLNIKNINCENDYREYKMVLQWHLKWLLQSIATGPDEFKKAYDKIFKLTAPFKEE